MHLVAKQALLFLALSHGIAAADEIHFGIAVPDPFRALEVSSAPATRAWLKTQDRATQTYFAALKNAPLWQDRLRTLIPEEDVALPRLVQSARRPPVDPHVLHISPLPSLVLPSPNGEYVIYAIYPQHGDAGELHVRALKNNREDPHDVLPWERYADVSWSADSAGFYYVAVSTTLPETERVAHETIRYHRIGESSTNAPDIYPATENSSRYLTPQASLDGRWLYVMVSDGFSGTVLRARDLTAATSSFMTVFASTSTTAALARSDQGSLYVLTNDHAPRYAVWMSSAPGAPWRHLIPEPAEGVWDSLQIAGHHLVLTRVHAASSELVVCSLQGTACHTLKLPEAGSIEEMETRADRDDFYFQFESFFSAPEIFQASVQTGVVVPYPMTSTTTVAAADARKPKTAWVIQNVQYRSADGKMIPMWILHASDLKPDGSHPTIMAVYGGFSVSMTPRYQAGIGAWLESGGIYAIPFLRGGGEFGEAWHAEGSGSQKQHTFDDAIAAAEFLIKNGYTSRDHLAIQGASNGGLTVAAVITQRPELFRAAVIKNPLTDMIRYPLFGEGQAWISEYGSPATEREFKVLWSYSPYHHVQSKIAYPAVLMLSAEADDRVDPMHARKFTAALQHANPSGRPVLFKVLHDTGHAGADSRTADRNEWTDRLLFLEYELGSPKKI